MLDHSKLHVQPVETPCARDWVKTLSAYRQPNISRSLFELAVTLGPFLGLWALAWWAMSISYVLTVVISLVNAGFLLRLFAIQHDCGHQSYFENRKYNDWLGRCLGVLTVTPYAVWRQAHSIHHGSSGNLGRRGMGDINTLTVSEFNAETPYNRLKYRLYRNPIVLFGFGPGYLFLLMNRYPFGFTKQSKFWLSAMGTNLGIAVLLGAIAYFGGLAPILLIFLPSTLFAATLGVWLFYIQHQFETTHWDDDADWQLHEAALEGSSHYVLPPVLRWMSANIGIHHVHHLYSRIPFYRLPEVLLDHTALAEQNRLSIRESLKCVRLNLWDEGSKRLVSFAEARELAQTTQRKAA